MKSMKVEEVLHMVGGSGENSYANNSRLQEKAILRTKPVVEEAISEICNTLHLDNFVVADLGCSSGPNTFLVITQIIEAIEQYYYQFKQNRPTIQYFLNDLPSNDFNNNFKLFMHYEKQLREEKGKVYVPIYVVGLPGSFYKRLFPSKSVHFFHSTYCLMWLSQGLMEEANLNAFNLPFYAPLMEEVESVIEEEGSFHLDVAETFESNWDPFDNSRDNFVMDSTLSGENVAKYMRAVVELLLSCHFGEDIMEDLFSRYAKNIAKHMLVEKPKFVLLLLALKLKE